MNIDQLVEQMTPEIYESMCRAVETGRWDNGESLTDQQKDDSLQLVLCYQSMRERSGEHFTIGGDGELVLKPKSELQRQFANDNNDEIHRNKA